MSPTISVRLTPELAEWLAKTAKEAGVSQGVFVRNQLERVRLREKGGFMRLAGLISGPRDLSSRKGWEVKGNCGHSGDLSHLEF